MGSKLCTAEEPLYHVKSHVVPDGQFLWVPMPCWAPRLADTIPPSFSLSPYVDLSASFSCFIPKSAGQEKRGQGSRAPSFALPPGGFPDSTIPHCPCSRETWIPPKNIIQYKTECDCPQQQNGLDVLPRRLWRKGRPREVKNLIQLGLNCLRCHHNRQCFGHISFQAPFLYTEEFFKIEIALYILLVFFTCVTW